MSKVGGSLPPAPPRFSAPETYQLGQAIHETMSTLHSPRLGLSTMSNRAIHKKRIFQYNQYLQRIVVTVRMRMAALLWVLPSQS